MTQQATTQHESSATLSVPAPPHWCPSCWAPMPDGSTGKCETCRRLEWGFDGCYGTVHFVGSDRRAVPASDRQYHGDGYTG